MRKIIYFILPFIILILLNNCSGYKPIFAAGNIEFNINKHTIKDNKILGNKFYSKLYNLSKSNKNNPEAQSVHVSIKASKEKTATVKDNTGKILEYKVTLNVSVIMKNFLTNNEILNQNFASFASYKIQDQYFESIKLENITINNLVNKTYQDLLIRISENMLTK